MTQSQLISQGLACADADVQSDVLNEFVLMLAALCKRRAGSDVGMQQFYIAHKLRGETVDFFRELVRTWEYLKQQADTKTLELRDVEQRLRDTEERLRQRQLELEAL